MLLTASTSPKLSLAPLIMKLFAVKKSPDKNAIVLPTARRVIRPKNQKVKVIEEFDLCFAIIIIIILLITR